MLSIQSPYSAEALVLEVETPFVYSRRTDECQNVSNAEIGRWLNSHGEVRHVNVQNLTELKSSLALYVDSRTALRLALYSADKDLDDSLREQAISFLDPLLNEPTFYGMGLYRSLVSFRQPTSRFDGSSSGNWVI